MSCSSSSSVSSSAFDPDTHDFYSLGGMEYGKTISKTKEEPENDEGLKGCKKEDYSDLAKKLSEVKDEIDKSDAFGGLKKRVVILGCTGVGKSSLINVIAGKKVYTKMNADDSKLYIEIENPLENCKVGHEAHSETDIPQKWDSEVEEISYWDTPGLDDNRGVVQEYKNAVYCEKLISSSRDIKLIIMCKSSDITERSGNLIYMARLLSNIFNEKIDQIKDSISLVVSYAPSNVNENIIRKEINKKLDSRFIFLDTNTRKFLIFLSQNITIFNKKIDYYPDNNYRGKVATLEDLRKSLAENVSKMKFASNIAKVNFPVFSMTDLPAIERAHNEDVIKIQEDIETNFKVKLKNLENNIVENLKNPLSKELLKSLENVSKDESAHKIIKDCTDTINKYIAYQIKDLLKTAEMIDNLKTLEKFIPAKSKMKFSYDIIGDIENEIKEFAQRLDTKEDIRPATASISTKADFKKHDHKIQSECNDFVAFLKRIFFFWRYL